MITQLALENFKSFAMPQVANLAPITLVYGPNSAGKSALIQSLLLLKQTLAGRDPGRPELVVQGPVVDLGSFQSLIHRHELGRTLRVGATFADVTIYQPSRQERGLRLVYSMPSQPVTAQFGFKWIPDAEIVWQSEALLSIPGESLYCSFERPYGLYDQEWDQEIDEFQFVDERSRHSWNLWLRAQIELKREEIAKYGPSPWEEPDLWLEDPDPSAIVDPRFTVSRLLPWRLMWRGKASADRAEDLLRLQATEIWDGYRHTIAGPLSSLLEDLTYLGPLRQPPMRYQISPGATRTHVGQEGEFYLEILGRDHELVGKVNRWLERLSVPYNLVVKSLSDEIVGNIHTLMLRDRRNGILVGPNDVGFGIGQLLPIVVQCLFGQHSTICIEQPEIHVHPRLQADMADLLIETSREPHMNQVIIETHSESMMLRLQRRIRDGDLKSVDVAVLYVDPAADGTAVIKPLRLDADGEFIDEWPAGFFEERFDEIFRS